MQPVSAGFAALIPSIMARSSATAASYSATNLGLSGIASHPYSCTTLFRMVAMNRIQAVDLLVNAGALRS